MKRACSAIVAELFADKQRNRGSFMMFKIRSG